MQPRKNDDNPATKPWESRRVSVPPRAGTTPRVGVSPQANKPTLLTSPDTLKTKIKKREDFLSDAFRLIKSLPGRLWRLPRKVLIGICLLLVIGYAVSNQLASHSPKTTKSTATTIKGRSSGLEHNAKPSFDTVVPNGKTITELGGWTRVSPDNRAPVYAYADKLANVPIRVSEQQLPPNFTGSDTDSKVEELSAGFKADQKLTVGKITAYIGTSAKGPQSVIFAKNSLLILIVSDQKIDNDHWTAYINSLQ